MSHNDHPINNYHYVGCQDGLGLDPYIEIADCNISSVALISVFWSKSIAERIKKAGQLLCEPAVFSIVMLVGARGFEPPTP